MTSQETSAARQAVRALLAARGVLAAVRAEGREPTVEESAIVEESVALAEDLSALLAERKAMGATP